VTSPPGIPAPGRTAPPPAGRSRGYADDEPGAIIAVPFPAGALRRVVVHGTIAALAACVTGAAR